MQDAEEGTTLASLPAELQSHLISHLAARDLGSVPLTCKLWSVATRRLARDRLERLLPPRCAHATEAALQPLRVLLDVERLTERVGPWPQRSWRDEWPSLRLGQARLLAANKSEQSLNALNEWVAQCGGDESVHAMFTEGRGRMSIADEARHSYASAIEWKLQAGWHPERALEVSLLASRCASALGKSIHEGRADFAASAWTVITALWERSWIEDALAAAVCEAPPAVAPACCYVHLEGEFGLATDDPAWAALRGRDAQPGLTLITSSLPFAMVANEQSFPNGAGFHMPITGDGAVSYVLAESDIVCFRPRSSQRSPFVATDEGIFRFPPMVQVTLLAIDEAGEWEVREGVTVERRLFTVSVDFAQL